MSACQRAKRCDLQSQPAPLFQHCSLAYPPIPPTSQTLKLVFKLLPGLDASEQLEQLSKLAGSTQLTANAVNAANMRMSVQQLDHRLVPSQYRRCRVAERYNFLRPTADLPKVIR